MIRKSVALEGLSGAEWWFELAREMNEEWEASVRFRPEKNKYRAGMDKTLRMLESRFLERSNAILLACSTS